MRTPFSFSKQIKRLQQGKTIALGRVKIFYPVIYELYYSYRSQACGAKAFFHWQITLIFAPK